MAIFFCNHNINFYELISILENQISEKRIAVTPEIAKKYIPLDLNLSLSENYGTHLVLVMQNI